MRFKEFCKKYKKALLNLLVFFIVILLLSGLIFLIFYLTGVLKLKPGGGLEFNLPMFDAIKSKWWSYLIYFLLQVVLTVILCFVPGTSMAFIMVGVGLWGSTWQTFLLVFAGVIASSILMDFIGRFGGVAIIKKLFGEEEYNKGKLLLREKGAVYLPVMYLFPMFPDDMLCCLAGLTRIKLWYHILVILLCRGIGISTIVFGIELIPFETFKTPWDWIVFVTVGIVWIYIIFKGARWIDKKLTKLLKDKSSNLNKYLLGDEEKLDDEQEITSSKEDIEKTKTEPTNELNEELKANKKEQ